MNELTASALRAAALAKLGGHEDPRAVEVLRTGVLAIDHHVSEWEASSGRVVAHRVRIGVPAELLGALRGHPHVEDEVTRILGLALAERPLEVAGDVLFHHDASSVRGGSTPYRGTSPRGASLPSELPALAAQLSEYLAAFGDADAASIARRSRIALSSRADRRGREHHDVEILVAGDEAEAARSRLAVIGAALKDLLAGLRLEGAAGPEVHVRIRRAA